MKMFFVSLLVLVVSTLGTGCSAIPRSANYARNTADGPAMAIGQSELPADPVRRSSSSFMSFDGSYNYSHSQGTDNYVSQSWDDYGPRKEVRQSTYNHTSESYYPVRRYRGWYGTVDDPKGPRGGTIYWPSRK